MHDTERNCIFDKLLMNLTNLVHVAAVARCRCIVECRSPYVVRQIDGVAVRFRQILGDVRALVDHRLVRKGEGVMTSSSRN